jgi:hypothetical protein
MAGSCIGPRGDVEEKYLASSGYQTPILSKKCFAYASKMKI